MDWCSKSNFAVTAFAHGQSRLNPQVTTVQQQRDATEAKRTADRVTTVGDGGDKNLPHFCMRAKTNTKKMIETVAHRDFRYTTGNAPADPMRARCSLESVRLAG